MKTKLFRTAICLCILVLVIAAFALPALAAGDVSGAID